MCLLVLAWNAHPRYRLVLAANRDEYHERRQGIGEDMARVNTPAVCSFRARRPHEIGVEHVGDC